MDLAGAVEEALRESGVAWRRVAVLEWGLTVPCGGWDLDVGVAVRGGMVVAQAEVVGPGAVSEFELLRRNRTLRLVLPVASVSVSEVDRLLGLLVAAAEGVRSA